ncbi:MAG: FtsH protease activity modulator HflK [Burkholderiaceae bacterium]
MNLSPTRHRWGAFTGRLRAIFNLNDPRWGRGGDDKPSGEEPRNQNNNGGKGQGPNQGPPDLDELWRDFNRKLGGLFGGQRRNGGGQGGNNGGGGGGNFQPDMRSTGIGVGIIAGLLLLIWLGTGIFIVQEGEKAVITRFGRYVGNVGAGINYRLPYPIDRHETVAVTQIRSVDVGRDNVVKSTGLRESAMLTEDENIVEIKFSVQYRLNDPRAFLFESRNPAEAVVQAAETSVREVVGKMRMDAVLTTERDQIAPRVRAIMQTLVDRYKIGVEIIGINLQGGGARPPEQVQAAFDDVLKAGQERERAKNEAEAYANQVIPLAVGSASRLKEEAEAYKARIVAQAQGDGQRFRSVQAEYAKAPQVTRDRLYLETMQEVYRNSTKVIVESRQGSNLLYLPLDKILQQGTPSAAAAADPLTPPSASGQAALPPAPAADARTRDSARTRDRETR